MGMPRHRCPVGKKPPLVRPLPSLAHTPSPRRQTPSPALLIPTMGETTNVESPIPYWPSPFFSRKRCMISCSCPPTMGNTPIRLSRSSSGPPKRPRPPRRRCELMARLVERTNTSALTTPAPSRRKAIAVLGVGHKGPNPRSSVRVRPRPLKCDAAHPLRNVTATRDLLTPTASPSMAGSLKVRP